MAHTIVVVVRAARVHSDAAPRGRAGAATVLILRTELMDLRSLDLEAACWARYSVGFPGAWWAKQRCRGFFEPTDRRICNPAKPRSVKRRRSCQASRSRAPASRTPKFVRRFAKQADQRTRRSDRQCCGGTRPVLGGKEGRQVRLEDGTARGRDSDRRLKSSSRRTRHQRSLQARTNTTMRSLNRAVLVIVSPITGLPTDRFGFGQAHTVAAAILTTAPLILALSPFRRARVT